MMVVVLIIAAMVVVAVSFLAFQLFYTSTVALDYIGSAENHDEKNNKANAAQPMEVVKQEAAGAAQQIDIMNQEATNIVEEEGQSQEETKEEVTSTDRKDEKGFASPNIFEPTVTLNVGGQLFTTTAATLTSYPDTMLGAMFSGRHALTQDKNGAYFIDRDGTHFGAILNFLRGTTSSKPESMAQLTPRALEELKDEAGFYGLKDRMFPVKLANPVVITSKAGHDATVTQDDDQLWYVRHPSINAPRLVVVCLQCAGGFVQLSETPGDYDMFPHFAVGRIVSSRQPEFPSHDKTVLLADERGLYFVSDTNSCPVCNESHPVNKPSKTK